MVSKQIEELVYYALTKGLIAPEECVWAVNALLEVLKLDAFAPTGEKPAQRELADILAELLDDAARRGVLAENTTEHRDLLDTAVMGRLTPRPAQVIDRFQSLHRDDPQRATDWYYAFSQDTNYIRRDRMARDLRWKTPTEYGALDITINLSKPEKDPKAIAAARSLPPSDYPRCLLCAENEGYAGRLNHPARQNHRIIPLTLGGEAWFLQYSPYVYYNEHCICLSGRHVPMKVDRACFTRLLEFTEAFPHYFIGANADLPIVGGSILAHDHFQGGRHTFAMETAPIEMPVEFPDFPDVSAGIVKWPMSALRIAGGDRTRLADLAEGILTAWRGYSDPTRQIFAHTDGQPHNTITPIARRRGELFELDLVLRNNLTTPQHPLGLYHPHQELHHIKKENIGLIEVMGLAVLPARLKEELGAVAEGLLSGGDLGGEEKTAKHAAWAWELAGRHTLTRENVWPVLQQEVGQVFCRVLEQAGVYARTPAGQEGFLHFLHTAAGGR